jgi:hypothetical protein
MKKVMIILAIIVFAGAVYGQKDPVNAIFEKYSGAAGYTTVNISGDMLNMITQAEQEKTDTPIVSKLTELRILVWEKDKNATPAPDFKSEVYDKLDKQAYKEMMTVKQDDEDVLILAKQSGERISEFLLIVTGKDDNVLLQAKGDILLREMADLAGKYKIKGFEQLKKMEK